MVRSTLGGGHDRHGCGEARARRRLACPLAVLLLGLVPNGARGQDAGYLRGEGRMDLALGWSLDSYAEYWVGAVRTSNDTDGFGRIDRHALSLYAAYGVTDALDVFGTLAFVSASSAFPERYKTETAPQDAAAGVKLRLFGVDLGPARVNVLVMPSFKIPMGSYLADGVLAIGDGNVDLRFHAIAQLVGPLGLYLAIESGYDARLGAPGDEVPIGVRAGGGVLDLVYPSVFFAKVISLDGYDIGEGPFPGTQKSFDRLGAHVFVRVLDPFGAYAAAWTTLGGENTGDVDGLALGVVLSL